MKKFFKLIIISLILSAGCETSKQEDTLSLDDTAAEVNKIRDHIAKGKEGVESGDVDAYFDAITDNFVYMLAGSKPVDNRDTLRSMLETFFANNKFSIPEMTDKNIEIWDDIAIHRYAASNIITSKTDSTVVELRRKYVDIYKKNEDGEWKVYLHLHFIQD